MRNSDFIYLKPLTISKVNNVEVQRGQEYILRDEDTLAFFTPFGKVLLPDGTEEKHSKISHPEYYKLT